MVENKDRTLVHKQDEILIEPTLTDWQVVIDKNKNKKSLVIANNLICGKYNNHFFIYIFANKNL